MNIVEQNLEISMIRDDLEAIPQYDIPDGFCISWYHPGDELRWAKIQAEADRYNTITPELFVRQFGDDPAELARRQCYLYMADKAIGTATAWFNPTYHNTMYGRIHWVAIVPSWQGYGLGRPLMTVACNRLRELGHTCAYLTTSTARIPAINLYRSFGFVPEIRNPQEGEIWRELEAYLKP